LSARLTPQEQRQREIKQMVYRQEHYQEPKIKLARQKWHKQYSRIESVKEAHRQAQRRYINSSKGRETRSKYRRKSK
jgi:hypothetical protein